MTLVPSEHTPTTPGVHELMAKVEQAKAENRNVFEIEKFVGFNRNGRPDYPKVTLRAALNTYGQPIASVSIRRTGTSYNDAFVGSLKDLDVRVACEYYLRLDSVEALDAVEKVLQAPTPKALALIALLGQLGMGQSSATQATGQPEQITQKKQEVIDV